MFVDMKEQEKIFAQISSTEVLEILSKLVRFRTVNPPGKTASCAQFISSLFQREKIKAKLIETEAEKVNVMAWLKGQSPGKTLLFNGHLDVVPPGADWPVDPFSAIFKKGELWGRGTCDMKSGIAAMIASLTAIKRSRVSFPGEIIFSGVCDEESGSKKGTQFLLKEGLIRADMAICSEPTDMAVEIGNRGQMSVEIKVAGRSSHAGRSHLGLNAIHFAADIIEKLKKLKLKSSRNELFEVPTGSLSVTKIQGGLTDDMIPDRCFLTVDIRLLPGDTFDSTLEQIKQEIEKMENPEGIKISYRMHGNFPPCLIPVDSPVSQAVIHNYGKVLGEEPLIRAKSAATDASHLVAAGIPTVIFGPGNSQYSHTNQERVSLSKVMASVRIYALSALDILRE